MIFLREELFGEISKNCLKYLHSCDTISSGRFFNFYIKLLFRGKEDLP